MDGLWWWRVSGCSRGGEGRVACSLKKSRRMYTKGLLCATASAAVPYPTCGAAARGGVSQAHSDVPSGIGRRRNLPTLPSITSAASMRSGVYASGLARRAARTRVGSC